MTQGPQASAAMVPALIVLAGGGGAGLDTECAKIYAQFDPPIITGTYSSVSSQRQEANRQAASSGSTSGFENQQSEHMVPNTNFQSTRGDSSTNIANAGEYSEGSGFCYNVYDGQSQGTEHRWLTDAEIAYADRVKAGKSEGTLKGWLDEMEGKASEMLDREDLQRTKGGDKRSRIKDAKKKTKEERKKLAEAAAKCLRLQAERQFQKQKVKPEIKLDNRLAGKRKLEPPSSGSLGGGAV